MEMRDEKVEAMQAVTEYNPRLLKGMENIVVELREDRKEDTDKYLESIIEGINWEIQILNRTIDLVNEEDEQINQDEANEIFKKFSSAYGSKDDMQIATIIEEDLIPFFTKLGQIAETLAKA